MTDEINQSDPPEQEWEAETESDRIAQRFPDVSLDELRKERQQQEIEGGNE